MEQTISNKNIHDTIDGCQEESMEIVDIELDPNKKIDEFEKFRNSRIVKMPEELKEENKKIQSVLTAFIKLVNDDGKKTV